MKPLAEASGAYLLPARNGQGKVFLITPIEHVGTEEDLPKGWDALVEHLWDKIPRLEEAVDAVQYYKHSNGGVGSPHLQLVVVLIFDRSEATYWNEPSYIPSPSGQQMTAAS